MQTATTHSLSHELSPIQRLAQRLRRPPISLNGLASLSETDLNWLNQQIDRLALEDEQRIRQQLQQKMPLPLRWVFLNRLRK